MQPAILLPPHKKNLAIFLAVILLFSLTGMLAVNAAFMVTDDIYAGVRVGDINVGGLSQQAAEQKISAAFRAKVAQAPITLIYDDKEWTITAAEIDLRVDAAALARQAHEVGRTGGVFNRLQERCLTINKGIALPMTVLYDHNKLYAALSNIARTLDREPMDATVVLSRAGVRKIVPEATGYKTNIVKTMGELVASFGASLPVTQPISVEEFLPAITAGDFNDIDGVVSSFSTNFDSGDFGRSENIYIAARNLSGTLVRQGETFSFNTNVGPRIAEYGYKKAPVFINGKLTPDWGGGVCQVSTTLYNAVLLADLEIVDRTPHFRPPAYVPLGRDATVADNQIDFKFRNNLPHNVYIVADVEHGQITVSVLGKLSANPPDIQIIAQDKKVLEPRTIVKQDPELELGKEIVEVGGQKGFFVTTYRLKYLNGRKVKKEYLAYDEFVPEDRVIRVGTKAPEQIKK